MAQAAISPQVNSASYYVTNDEKLARILQRLGYVRFKYNVADLPLSQYEQATSFIFPSSARIVQLANLYYRGLLKLPE